MSMIRFAWQHRRELVPVWAVLGTAAWGLFVRAISPELSVAVALSCLPLAALGLWASRLASKWRRRWIWALLAGALCWVVWLHEGDGRGAALGLLITLLVFGVAVYGGRILNRPLAEKVSMEDELRDWPETAKRIGLDKTRWVKTTLLPGQGWTARLAWDRGAYDVDEVIRKVHRIEGARGLPAGSLRLLKRGRDRNSLDAIFVADDPHTEAIEWPGVKADANGDPLSYSVVDPVPLGQHEDGTIPTIQRFRPGKGERRVLVGGASESGKSGVINNLVGEDACRDDVVALNMDLKGGVELGPWKKVAAWTVKDIPGAIQMMKAIGAAITYRLSFMEERGMRVWNPSPDFPAIHVNVDEIRKLAGSSSGRTGKEARQLLDELIDLATQGRAVGLGLLAAGQLLTLEALGSSQIRSQFDIRIGLRMNEAKSTAFLFPDDDVRLHEIPGDRPGMGYLKDGDRFNPLPWRGYWWPDELVEAIAELRRGRADGLDQGTGDAMAAVSPTFAEIWSQRRGHPSPTDGDDDGDGPERVSLGKEDGMIPDWSGGDTLSLAEVVKRNRERRGVTNIIGLRPRAGERLDEDGARRAVWALLAQHGGRGAPARELYRGATRSSSWFHPLIEDWAQRGLVQRTRHGHYALTGTSSDYPG